MPEYATESNMDVNLFAGSDIDVHVSEHEVLTLTVSRAVVCQSHAS